MIRSFHLFKSALLISISLPFILSISKIEEDIIKPVDSKLLLVTVATEPTEGFQRFLRSAKKFDLTVEVLGMGQDWKGGDVQKYPGGGQKIKLFKTFLDTVDEKEHPVVMFTDAYDVVVNGESAEIVKRFKNLRTNILFSAEEFCWPDANLKVKYPVVKTGKRYLNSGMFIGYTVALKKLLQHASNVDDSQDDQLFYTKLFLDEKLKTDLDIKLDHVSELFQNLNGASDDVDLSFGTNKYSKQHVTLRNFAYSTEPLIVHGNGASKVFLNHLANYLGKAWITDSGCVDCAELGNKFTTMKEKDLPEITMAIFVEQPTPFLDDFFRKISALQYPKKNIMLFVHNREANHDDAVVEFVSGNGTLYKSAKIFNSASKTDEREARDIAINLALEAKSAYLFVVDSDVRLIDPLIIQKLMDTEKSIVAPMIPKRKKLYSNFWGALSEDGFYARSDDYVDIVEHKREGIWNVPYISSIYLINADRLKTLVGAYSSQKLYDPDMSFTRFCIDKGYFIYVDNRERYGHLICNDELDLTRKHPEFYEMFDNQEDWEREYLHENFSHVVNQSTEIDQPCPDVYWFPIFNEKFCKHLIDIMENYGKWSSGNNKDERLSGGYENVPTRDIHMNQVGLERHWLYMLDQYFRPMQEKLFTGYFHVPPHAIMNFVVRYRPDEQPSLKPHHDASTYTVNLALNQHGVDYEGGGAHFLRYNCSVVKSRPGWALLHPGRLTHLHEGLPTTKGTRYIMVSFVDP